MENQYLAKIGALETVFGTASETGFGSAVFHEVVEPAESIERIALRHYKTFMGPKWKAETESAWMLGFKNVYKRSSREGGIISELASVSDADAKRSLPLLTEFISDSVAAANALSLNFDNKQVKELSMFTIGDGEAMAGIMIAAIYDSSYSCSVIALMD